MINPNDYYKVLSNSEPNLDSPRGSNNNLIHISDGKPHS